MSASFTSTDAVSLKKWVIEELGVPGLTADCDLGYIFKGELIAVWTYLIRNVVNRSRAKLIHGNLRLHQLQSSPSSHPEASVEGTSLQTKVKTYKKLLQQISRQRREVTDLENTIRSQQVRLSAASQAARKQKTTLHEVRIKACLLSQHQDVICNHLLIFHKFRTNLEHYLQNNNIERQRHLRVDRSHSKHESGGQNVHLSQMRKLHNSVCDFINLLLLGSLSKLQLQKEKNRIKTLLGQVMSTIGSSTVLDYIIHDANRCREKITHDTQLIDYVKDAEQLRFKVESDGLVDKAIETPLDVGVTQLIEQGQMEHQERFLETENYRTECVLLNRKLVYLKATVSSQMTSCLPDKDPKIKILKDILENRIAEKQAKAALEVVTSMKSAFDQQIHQTSENLAKLRQKEKAIASFRTNVHHKQNQICVLMKQNVNSQSKLDDRQGKLVATISTLSSNTEPLAALNSTVIADNYATEMSQFHSIPLYSLSANPHSVIVGMQQHTSGKASKNIQQLCQLLGCDNYLANDVVLQGILDKQTDIVRSYTRTPSVRSAATPRLVNAISNDLLPQVKQQHCEMIRELVPQLERSKELVSRGTAKCDKVNSLIDDWWKQPALQLGL